MSIKYKKDGIEINGEFLSLKTITEKCNEVKVKENSLVILEMGLDVRGGSVFEQRALPLKSALRVKDILLGEEVYFGEIWGKHSEVYGNMTESTFKIVKDKKEVKKFLTNYPSGVEYDHSFIESFLERSKEELEYDPEYEITQEIIDELESLIK